MGLSKLSVFSVTQLHIRTVCSYVIIRHGSYQEIAEADSHVVEVDSIGDESVERVVSRACVGYHVAIGVKMAHLTMGGN